MKKLITLTALIIAITAVAIGAASFQGPWMMPDTTKVSDYVPNAVDLYLPSNPTTGYSWTYEIEDMSISHRVWDQTWSVQAERTGSTFQENSRVPPV